MKRFAVFPDYVISKTDGEDHYISSIQLIHLYNVDPTECVIVDRRSAQHQHTCLDGLIQLHPNYDGDYKQFWRQHEDCGN
jgi:hypothetical protein